MKNRSEIEKILKELKPLLVRDFYVDRIGYFGSYSQGEQNQESDIDILVSFRKPLGWEFFRLRDLLESKLGIRVDLISDKALKKQMRKNILESVRYL